MAFTVAQRWREIGLRAALGAQPRRLIPGCSVVRWSRSSSARSPDVYWRLRFIPAPIAEAGGHRIPGIVPVSAAFMIIVGLLAVAGPARRAVRVNPTEALRVSQGYALSDNRHADVVFLGT